MAAFQYLKGAYGDGGEGLFIGDCSVRTRGNGFKLKQGKFRLDIRGKFFTVRVVRHWNGSCECSIPGGVQGQAGQSLG